MLFRSSTFISCAWCCFSIIVLWRFPKTRTFGRLREYDSIFGWAFLAGAILIVINILAGLFVDSIGSSPYDRSISGIVRNLFGAIPLVIGQEIIRSYILNSKREYKRFIYNFIFVVILFLLMDQNFTKISLIGSFKDATIYAFEYILPSLAKNILLCVFVLHGGALASIIYCMLPLLFEWIFPVLPSLQWLTKAVIGICLPLVFLCFFGEGNQLPELFGQALKHGGHKKEENSISLFLTTAVCVLFIWFFAGVFNIYPSVVLTGSMEPILYPGDMILVDKITDEAELKKLKVGDVLTFKRDDIIITHRIIEIVEDEAGNISYRTKGDNNSVEDDRLVLQNEVKGLFVNNLPKIGLPVLWLKGTKEDVVENVEF